jgi:hypothetical protein
MSGRLRSFLYPRSRSTPWTCRRTPDLLGARSSSPSPQGRGALRHSAHAPPTTIQSCGSVHPQTTCAQGCWRGVYVRAGPWSSSGVGGWLPPTALSEASSSDDSRTQGPDLQIAHVGRQGDPAPARGCRSRGMLSRPRGSSLRPAVRSRPWRRTPPGIWGTSAEQSIRPWVATVDEPPGTRGPGSSYLGKVKQAPPNRMLCRLATEANGGLLLRESRLGARAAIRAW